MTDIAKTAAALAPLLALALAPPLALAGDAIVWGRVLPTTIKVSVRRRIRRFRRDGQGKESLTHDDRTELTSSLKRRGSGERYRGDFKSVKTKITDGEDGAENERGGTILVAHNRGRWVEPEPGGSGSGLPPALSRGSALRGLIPADRGPRPGERWTLPYKQLCQRFGLEDLAFDVQTETAAELRFIGLREIDGVPCQAYSLLFEAESARFQQRVKLRLSGLLLLEQRSGLPRLFNLGSSRVTHQLGADGPVFEERILARIREQLTAAVKKP